MNYKLLIQYDGTDYHGWQVQDNARTIQGELERVASLLEGSSVKVHGSGRTDAGVHAEGQIAHMHLTREFTPEKLRGAINGNLSRDIRVMDVETVPDDFHARFSAKSKTYIYRVVNAPAMSPFWLRFAKHEARPLDVEAMRQTAEIFIGEHDWTAFSNAQSDGESRIRTITELAVSKCHDKKANGDLIEFRVSANGFLRYMVRSIVGTLLEVGRGEKDAEVVKIAIDEGIRELAGPTAAANGLTLHKVYYD